MAKRAPRFVTLTPRHASLVERLVREGRYRSEQAVVGDSLRLLAEHHKAREKKIRWLRREIEKAARSVARGDVYEADEVFAELDRREAAATSRRRRKSA